MPAVIGGLDHRTSYDEGTTEPRMTRVPSEGQSTNLRFSFQPVFYFPCLQCFQLARNANWLRKLVQFRSKVLRGQVFLSISDIRLLVSVKYLTSCRIVSSNYFITTLFNIILFAYLFNISTVILVLQREIMFMSRAPSRITLLSFSLFDNIITHPSSEIASQSSYGIPETRFFTILNYVGGILRPS
jgi:hypothetical protein